MDEREAIRACRVGDRAGLAALFELYRSAVFRTAYALLRQREAADDVTQQVFIELPKALARFDPNRSVAPWIHRVAVNMSLHALRREKNRRSDMPLDEAISWPSRDRLPDEASEDIEMRDTIWKALGALDPRQRVAVVLKFYHGLSEEDMAIAMRCRKGTVKSRLHYGLRNLEKILSSDPSFHGGAAFGDRIKGDWCAVTPTTYSGER